MDKIRLDDITHIYSPGTPFETVALDHVSVGFESGKITGIIGHTGSGKSTLVQMLNGLIKPATGQVFLDEKDIWEKPKEISKIRYQVGLVMQYPEYQLFEETVEKDIAYGPQNMGLPAEEIKKRVLESADFVGLERSLLSKSPFDLSGGQKRRAAIAGIMAMEPGVLVLDEPAAGLDPRGKDIIFAGIQQYQQSKKATVLIISHSMEDMAKICDNIVVLSHSHVIAKGTKDEIFAHPDVLTEVGLDVPQVTFMMSKLREHGIPVRDGIYTVEAAVEELKKLLSPNGKAGDCR